MDNIVFISVIAGRLPPGQRDKARRLGLLMAMGLRILLLLTITWIMGLDKAIFTILDEPFTWKDIILIVGGLFLLAKATTEIHAQLEGPEVEEGTKVVTTFSGVLAQIIAIDLVFSVDSVITAVGMAQHLWVMILAIILAVGGLGPKTVATLWKQGGVETLAQLQQKIADGELSDLPRLGAKTLAKIARSIEFGESYSQTLRRWHQDFNARWDDVALLGFDDRFRRMWNFYLMSSRAAFEVEDLHLWHLFMTRYGSGRGVYDRVKHKSSTTPTRQSAATAAFERSPVSA